MANILIIESTGHNCSVAICNDEGHIIASVEENSREGYIHSEKLHPFIEKALKEAKLLYSNIDAIAVSEGPGSYTGLRYGVSAAKGFCAALNIPLIACNPFKAMVAKYQSKASNNVKPIAAMIDARRQEVFMQCFSASGNVLNDVKAYILDEKHGYKNHVWIGDGADKFIGGFIDNSDIEIFQDILPSASYHIGEACNKFKKKDFVNVAYFVPFYLKDFVATKPKTKFSIRGIPKAK